MQPNMKLYEARKRAKLSRKKLASEVGVNAALYRRAEYGESWINVIAAMRIAKRLGSTVEELFGDVE